MTRINVTKSFTPPREEYEAYLKQIWDRGYLTNGGPLSLEFEEKARHYLGVNNFQFVANGTLALQLALRSLGGDGGEIITTPFSYVATTSAIVWEGYTPIFVDILEDTFCIDASKIEAAITPQTKAILAVHVFGVPCEVEKIERIAKKYDLKVIYDGAHAFGVNYKDRSLLSYGDISTCSFHATKLFHTIEGGCVIANDPEINATIDLMKRFGHNGDEHIMLGINAKASEFQAAMGLCNLNYIDSIVAGRKNVVERYNKRLGGRFQTLKHDNETYYNFAYYPVVLDDEAQLHTVKSKLEEHDVFPRRYFYPSLNKLPYIDSAISCPVSEDIASRTLCLPLYDDLAGEDVDRICKLLLE